MKKLLSLILVAAGTIFLMSCRNSSSGGQTSADNLVGKEFMLTNMYEDKEVTISFPETNMIGGKSAVNLYFTEFALDGNNIIFSALGSTKMAGPEEDMDAENEYFQILNGADTISLNGDVLTITTDSGTNLIYIYKGEIPAVNTNN